MDPVKYKALQRVAGMTLSALGSGMATSGLFTGVQLVGAIIAAIGGLLIGQANRAKGDVSGTDVTAILNAARTALAPGQEMTLRPSNAPPAKK